jgi:hypothetical protein
MKEIPGDRPPTEKPGHRFDLYDLAVRLAMHSQENKLQTLNLYLVFNSIILLAWVTLFSAVSPNFTAKLVSTLLCILGVLFALVWLPLGWDYANASDSFSELAERLEDQFPEGERPMRPRAQQKGSKLPIGSRTILVLTPLVFLISYVFLLGVVWAPKQ